MHQQVIEGRPYLDAVRDTLAQWNARRVVIATNTSLAREGMLGQRLAIALQDRCVQFVSGVRAHAPRDDVLALSRALRDVDADALVGIGGGSITSAVKIARLLHANGVDDHDGIDALVEHGAPVAPRPKCIMLPTTLSGGEYTAMAGTTDMRMRRKDAVRHPALAPDIVVMDPDLVQETPRDLLLGTAIRALDHLVETWCSTGRTVRGDKCTEHGLPLLLEGLRCDDLLKCQQAARWAIHGIASGIPQGASHGIGHALGGVAGVSHGHSSCIMLPHVLRFNEKANGDRQDALLKLWPGASAATKLPHHVHELVASLGLPQRLRETGIAEAELAEVAQDAMRSPWVGTNPRRFDGLDQVLELLQEAW